ncbi:GPP34 family phosphoprotein [Glycomyces sp. YM15]|uniref:GOLPH3/VPS74 family protein n=1 Tax=Glycomyces sp. YM15 TaxID=2800446 RepID=UPI001965BFE8|nr:GPP34 family phosphoprotein [Glycomyces sp. YM15]
MYAISSPRKPGADDLEFVDEVYFSLLDEHSFALTVTGGIASLGLAAAVLTDLIGDQFLHLDAAEGKLQALGAADRCPRSALAHTVWETIAAQHAVLAVSDWLRYWAADDFATRAAERMVYRGLLTRSERRRRFSRDTVDYDPVDRTLAPWPLVRLRRRLTQPHQERPTSRDLHLYCILTALDLTGRLGDAAHAVDTSRAHAALPQPLRTLFDQLRAAAGAAALTTGT